MVAAGLALGLGGGGLAWAMDATTGADLNRAHAKIRARGERAIATLKGWKILVKLRCCPRRATAIVQAILVLHHVENPIY